MISISNKKKIIIPKHVAIIMDGNNRWTKKHKLKGFKGHEKGIDAIQTAINCSKSFGIKFLTLFSFSSENWNRPKKEVNFLMGLLREYLKNNPLLKEEWIDYGAGIQEDDESTYEEDDIDATDLYGLSKYLGEAGGNNCLTIRTSIIGRELNTKNGLVNYVWKNNKYVRY